MAEKIELIQLEMTDDATSLRDRLSFLRGQQVLLVWPETGTALTRKLDLVLIQREAARMAIRLALVTHDPDVIRHAIELEISVFETIGSAQRGKWRRARSKVFTTRSQRPKDEPEADQLMPVASRVRVDEPPASRARTIVRLIILGVLIAVFGGIGYVVAPSAIVSITPARAQTQVEAVIIADPSFEQTQIDLQSGVIPALTLRIEVEERATIESSGRRSLGATPAVGSVVFINKTANSVVIPMGSFVSTSAGTPIIFRTTQEAMVSGGAGLQIEVPVEAVAESSGEIGNDIGVGLINTIIGNLGEQLEVRNFAPTYGGISSLVRIVTADDHERLTDILRQQIQARAYTEMLPRISDTQFIIPETIRITQERDDWTRFDSEINDAVDNLSLTMRAVVEATVVEEQFAHQIAYLQLSNQIPRGRNIDPATLTYQRAGDVTIDHEGRVTFSVTAQALVSAQLNNGQIQERLAGRSVADALRYLTSTLDLMDGSTPEITISPDWFGQMPILPMRITIQQPIADTNPE